MIPREQLERDQKDYAATLAEEKRKSGNASVPSEPETEMASVDAVIKGPDGDTPATISGTKEDLVGLGMLDHDQALANVPIEGTDRDLEVSTQAIDAAEDLGLGDDFIANAIAMEEEIEGIDLGLNTQDGEDA